MNYFAVIDPDTGDGATLFMIPQPEIGELWPPSVWAKEIRNGVWKPSWVGNKMCKEHFPTYEFAAVYIKPLKLVLFEDE